MVRMLRQAKHTRLVTNTYIAKLVGGSERTGILGMLQGAVMIGTAAGYLCKQSL